MKLATTALILALSAPAFAQSTTPHLPATEKPIDKGPSSPETNGAYQGGGVVLKNAPNAPALVPQVTPPSQAPAESIDALPLRSLNTPPSKAADD